MVRRLSYNGLFMCGWDGVSNCPGKITDNNNLYLYSMKFYPSRSLFIDFDDDNYKDKESMALAGYDYILSHPNTMIFGHSAGGDSAILIFREIHKSQIKDFDNVAGILIMDPGMGTSTISSKELIDYLRIGIENNVKVFIALTASEADNYYAPLNVFDVDNYKLVVYDSLTHSNISSSDQVLNDFFNFIGK